MKLSTKLNGSFLALAAITAIVALVGYRGLSQAQKYQQTSLEDATALREAVDLARRAQVGFKIQVQEWKNILLRGSSEEAFQKYFTGFTNKEADAQSDLAALAALQPRLGFVTTNLAFASSAHLELGAKYRDALKEFSSTNANAAAAVDRLVKGIDRAPTEAFDGIVADIVSFAQAKALSAKQLSLAHNRRGQMICIVGGSLAMLFSLLLGYAASRAVSRHIQEVAGRLRDGANQVATAAGQVSAASQTIAEGATEQAASLEEAAASLEEMASMTKRNAESAQQAKTLAGQARHSADASTNDVKSMTAAMAEVKSSSEQITKIIKTIDEIAFQTNILALNAAVEAARAGDAGAGFSVVADEVRNLAQRSAQAARETANKIEDALKKIDQGVQISGQVASGLGEITLKIREVDQLAAEIAAASNEQSDGIGQITTAVAQMDKVTQSNAATAEQTASASEELTSQARSLKDEVGRLAGSDTSAEPAGPKSSVTAPAAIQPAAGAAPAAKPEKKVAAPAARNGKHVEHGRNGGVLACDFHDM